MQRTGRKGHAQFRMIVQDSKRSPSSGRVVANLGSYNPHTKETNIDKEKASTFLSNGAQPSERAARILKSDGVKLPSWVKIVESSKKTTKNAEKLRKNRPAEEAPVKEVQAEAPVEEAPLKEEAPAAESTTEEEKPAELSEAEETPTEETKQA